MKYKNIAFILIFLLVALVPLTDLVKTGLPLTHDGQDHVARIANFYQNLKEGNVVPRWAGNLNWGYGHPILMFLYPLPSYMISLLYFIGFSLIDSVKILLGLGFIASGLTMYVWIKEFLGVRAAFVGGILYMFAPYRFVDLYVRGAIGEHMAFVFLPLILYFLLKLSKDNCKYTGIFAIGGVLSFSGLILSHNAITLMFLPIIFLYGFYLFLQSRNRKPDILSFIYLVLLGFGLSAFFWMPAFFEGKYTLRDIVTSKDYYSRFVEFKDFIYGYWSYGGTLQLSKQIGIVHWILTLVSIPVTFILFKQRNKLWVLSLMFLLFFACSIFLMMQYSKVVWDNIAILQKFQFPWRFLSISVFTAAFLGALVISAIQKKIQIFAILSLLLVVLFFNKDYWHAKDYLLKPESFFTGVYYGTTDTGESAPIWSVRFMEKPAEANIEVISGKAKIEELKRSSTKHHYKIITQEQSRIRENTLYFPGWNVYVNGEKTDIEFQDPANRGLITYYLREGEHDVLVKFEETKLRLIANIISGFSLFFILTLGILRRSDIWRRFQ